MSAQLVAVDGFPPDDDDESARATSVYQPDDPSSSISDLIRVLGKSADIYQRANRLVFVIVNLDAAGRAIGLPTFRTMTPANLRDCAGRIFCLYKQGANGTHVRCKIPDDVIHGTLERGKYPGIRTATNIIEQPVIRADGTIFETAGHDPNTGLVLVPSGEFLPVPNEPTQEDALAAYGRLESLVSDFPFAEPCHLSAILAGLFTLFARPVIDGPTPMFMIEATTRGSGKGKLIDTIGIIATGRDVEKAPYSHEPEELRKSIGSVMIGGQTLLVFDNIDGSIGDPTLDLLLTSRTYSDRMLGSLERIRLQNDVVIFASANNPNYKGDTARRTMPSRLESLVENPENRSNFRHPDIISHAKKCRAEYVRDVLTILRAFFLAGKPRGTTPTWGSFEAWSALIPPIFQWLEKPDPMQSRRSIEADADPVRNALATILAGWKKMDATGEGVTVSQVVKLLFPDDFKRTEGPPEPEYFEGLREAMVALAPVKGKEKCDKKLLGEKIARSRGRVVNGMRFVDNGTLHGSKRWRAETVFAPAPAPQPDPNDIEREAIQMEDDDGF